jgi:hypothetical protein
MAAEMGAKPPRRVPLWLAKLVVGGLAAQMVAQRGSSNAKARRELGFAPRYPTYREGFPAVFRAGGYAASTGVDAAADGSAATSADGSARTSGDGSAGTSGGGSAAGTGSAAGSA